MPDIDARNNEPLLEQVLPRLVNDAQTDAAARVREGLDTAHLPIIERVVEAEIAPPPKVM